MKLYFKILVIIYLQLGINLAAHPQGKPPEKNKLVLAAHLWFGYFPKGHAGSWG